LMRAVIEGVAMEGRAGMIPLSRFAGLSSVSDVKVIGGTSRNRLLIEVKASVMNARHHLLRLDEASALGAAMLGGMAAGVYRSSDEAIAAIVVDAEAIDPFPDVVALYDTLFNDVYRHLYEALRPMHHRLFDLFALQEDEMRA
jgi:xylulokinase